VRRIQPHVPGRAVHLRAGSREQVERTVAEDLHADLSEDPQRRSVDRLDLVLGQDLDRPIRVDESTPRQLTDATRCAARSPLDRLVLCHVRMLRGGVAVLSAVSETDR
jgi:hypothetical protein